MILTFDVETQGLDARKFILGCMITQTGDKYTFHDKGKMWEKILEIGEEQEKRNEGLTCYAHNISYDFYSICPWNNDGLKIYCLNPFIANYKNISFIDSMGLFKGSLEKLGQLINMEKGKTPDWVKQDEYEPNEIELWLLSTYCMQDCEVLMKGIQWIKSSLREQGIRPRELITIGQASMSGYLNYLSNRPDAYEYFTVTETGPNTFYQTSYEEMILSSYHGPRVEVFKEGHHENVHSVDVNSMYPWCMTLIDYPKLHTERETTDRECINEIGVTKAVVKTNKNETLGILGIRKDGELIFPKGEKILIGTWNNDELRYAIEEGCQLLEVIDSVVYEKNEVNPLKEYIERLYEKKKNAKKEGERWIYKQLMNHLYGKFAQRKKRVHFKIDSVENAKELMSKGWTINMGLDKKNYLYKKESDEEKKRFYAPLLSSMITAKARIELHKLLKRVDPIYCDTDGFMYGGEINEFKYSDDIGELKYVKYHENIYVPNKKTYTDGIITKASGVRREDITSEMILNRTGTTKRMITINTAKNKEEIGSFKETTYKLEEKQEEELPYIMIDDKEINEKNLEIMKKWAEEEQWET